MKRPTEIVVGDFPRACGGPRIAEMREIEGLTPGECCGWQSNGGPGRSPARALPSVLMIEGPSRPTPLLRLHLLGVFALWGERDQPGVAGASLQFSGREECVRLIAGRHYDGVDDLKSPPRLVGDGTSLETVGTAECEGRICRLDLLSLDVPDGVVSPRLLFRDLGTIASFVFFDAFFEFEQTPACPFSARGGGIPLSELGSVVRLGDRRRFAQALDQLETGVHRSDDLDEARSMALTFLAVVAAALLELGAPKEVHRLQLNAARRFDELEDRAAIVEAVRTMLAPVATSLVQQTASPGDPLIDRALGLVERNFARDLCDDEVARQLGLSTSHFRFLFRQVTGKPFHQYVIQARMERARQMLLRHDIPVAEVAKAVGYGSAAHFSRVFTRLFAISPSAIRQARR